MAPRLLTDAEFKATFSDRMVDIKGREDLVSTKGVIDSNRTSGRRSRHRSSAAPLRLASHGGLSDVG